MGIFMNMDEIYANKLRFLELLGEVPRAGLPELLVALEEGGFFESPASSRFHGCELGGLCAHSLGVFEVLESFVLLTDLDVPRESLVFAALLHDVCKMGLYVESDTAKSGWACNKEHPKGHAVLSIEIVQRFVELSEVEELMIRFHMGVYGLTEFEPKRGEFPLRGGGLANAWNKHPVVKLMYFADEIGSLCEQQRDVASD
jgi:hypothetical protein